MGFSKKCSQKAVTVIGNNIASFNGKKESFLHMISEFCPGAVLLQETKLYQKGSVMVNDYCVFEKLRSQGEGGGLLTMVHENFNPVLIPVSSQVQAAENILVVEAELGKQKIRCINGYGVQESSPVSDKIEFISVLDEEIDLAVECGSLVCIQLDGNAKFGNMIIKKDPNEMSTNGKLFLDLFLRKN